MRKKFLTLVLLAASSSAYAYKLSNMLDGASSLEINAGTTLFYTPEIFNFKAGDSSIKQKGEFRLKLPYLYASFSVALTDNIEIGVEGGGVNLLGAFINNFDFEYNYEITNDSKLWGNLISGIEKQEGLDLQTIDARLATLNFLNNPLTKVKATQNIKTKYIAGKLSIPFEIYDGLTFNIGGTAGIGKLTVKDFLESNADDKKQTVSYSVDDWTMITGLNAGVKYEFNDNISFGFNILWKNYSPTKAKTEATYLDKTLALFKNDTTPTTIPLVTNKDASEFGFSHYAWSISMAIAF
ncbi:MAG: hypothetical protein K9G11_01590 [Rickettsiaceae bacterium]|nr:hypothetical protein [Rickettsiaceae bacterium]